MRDWQVLLLTGPAGAGKTTTARRFAEMQPQPSVHLSLDTMRGSVMAGFANPVDGWDFEVARQYALAQRATAYAARLYAQAGFKVVIDDAIFPEWEEANLERWLKALHGLPACVIVLMPRLEVTLERNDERRGGHHLPQDLVRLIYDMMAPWAKQDHPLIDNSDLTVEATAERIASELKV